MANATEAVAVEAKTEDRKALIAKRAKTVKTKAVSKKKAKPSKAKAPKAKKAKRLTEAELSKRYPHFVAGSLHFSESEQRNCCKLACIERGCKKTREVATSDLFQVKRCVEHT